MRGEEPRGAPAQLASALAATASQSHAPAADSCEMRCGWICMHFSIIAGMLSHRTWIYKPIEYMRAPQKAQAVRRYE